MTSEFMGYGFEHFWGLKAVPELEKLLTTVLDDRGGATSPLVQITLLSPSLRCWNAGWSDRLRGKFSPNYSDFISASLPQLRHNLSLKTKRAQRRGGMRVSAHFLSLSLSPLKSQFSKDVEINAVSISKCWIKLEGWLLPLWLKTSCLWGSITTRYAYQ